MMKSHLKWGHLNNKNVSSYIIEPGWNDPVKLGHMTQQGSEESRLLIEHPLDLTQRTRHN